MTIQDWGAIGEVVGAIAVVVTLAYLATQVRYARLAASDTSRQGRADGVREILLNVVNNPGFRGAWRKADPLSEANLSALAERLGAGITVDEADMIWHGACAWAYLHWAQFRAIKTPEDERELESLIAGFYSRPPMSILWSGDEILRSLVDPDFVRWVDGIIASSTARPGEGADS
jgi:hypothetical protein